MVRVSRHGFSEPQPTYSAPAFPPGSSIRSNFKPARSFALADLIPDAVHSHVEPSVHRASRRCRVTHVFARILVVQAARSQETSAPRPSPNGPPSCRRLQDRAALERERTCPGVFRRLQQILQLHGQQGIQLGGTCDDSRYRGKARSSRRTHQSAPRRMRRSVERAARSGSRRCVDGPGQIGLSSRMNSTSSSGALSIVRLRVGGRKKRSWRFSTPRWRAIPIRRLATAKIRRRQRRIAHRTQQTADAERIGHDQRVDALTEPTGSISGTNEPIVAVAVAYSIS